MAKDASGIILVSDADQMNIKDLESWFALSIYRSISQWTSISFHFI